MTRYELRNFKNGKAFIYQEECINGSIVIGNRICINTKGEKLFELPHPDMIVNDFEDEDVAFVYYEGKEALINDKGKFLAEFIYDSIYGGSEEGLFEVKKNGKHGHIDLNGKEIIPCMYDHGCYFSEGVAAECLNGKWGMVDCFNNTVIPFAYEYLSICKSNIISACKNGKYGLINKNNEILVDFTYDNIDCFGTREALVVPAKKNNKYGLIDRMGNIIEDFIYDEAQLISDEDNNLGEFITLEKNKKIALYSTRKKCFLTDFKYDFIDLLCEDRIRAEKSNKIGFLNKNGEEIIPFEYNINSRNDFSEEAAVVVKDEKYGAIDIYGNVIIPFEYKKLYECNDGLFCAVKYDNTTGYIDKNNKTIIPFGKFDCLNACFHEGFAIVHDNKLGKVYINKEGEVLEIKV